jgi:hypothetical protein
MTNQSLPKKQRQGVEKTLGKNSTSPGAKMTTFDPDAGWNEVPH